MHWHFSKRNRKNFSFLQILIAIAIIGIAVVPAINVFISSTRAVAQGNAYLEATIAGQYILDSVKNDGFIARYMNKTVTIPSDALPEIQIPKHFREAYNGYADVAIRYWKNHHDMRHITVTIHWKEKNKDHSTVLSTLSANMNDIIFRND